jgi:uncharacterized protein YndB with AHSA1/START domain
VTDTTGDISAIEVGATEVSATEVSATSRSVGADPGGHRVVLCRRYQAPAEDVWDACTSPERIARWLTPVTGDLRPGGSYQLQGNAGGSILRCEPPRLLRVSWVFGDAPPSEVELRLSEDDGGTLLELEHSGLADAALWAQFGPGAVGVGWDLALLGLGLHLAGQAKPDPVAWLGSATGREFVTQSSQAWRAAFEASGASAAEAAAAARQTTAFYTQSQS